MAAYYNEFDPFAAQWLRNLILAGHIAPGEVDERSIRDVAADDLDGFTQCHFFAGIGGWSYAARLARWPDDRELWTGSCPCQPFSSASRGRGKGEDDDRHLWPVWRRLILRRRPAIVFGEQVAAARAWLDCVRADMAAGDYAVWSAVLPAYAVGADHARERIYFACHADGESQSSGAVYGEMAGLSRDRSVAGGMGPAHGISDRMARLRAFGNAIVPQVAAEVIGAFLECAP